VKRQTKLPFKVNRPNGVMAKKLKVNPGRLMYCANINGVIKTVANPVVNIKDDEAPHHHSLVMFDVYCVLIFYVCFVGVCGGTVFVGLLCMC